MAAASPSSVVGWPVVGPMGRSICNVSWMPKNAYPDVSDADYAAFNAECGANARLIAAAPDLLAALKLIANENRGGSECLWYRGVARKAVEKVEGRAP